MQRITVPLTAVVFLLLLAAVLAVARTPRDESFLRLKTNEANVDAKRVSQIDSKVCSTQGAQICVPSHFNLEAQRKNSTSIPRWENPVVLTSYMQTDSGYGSLLMEPFSRPAETLPLFSPNRAGSFAYLVTLPQADAGERGKPLSFSGANSKTNEDLASLIREDLAFVSHPVSLLLFGLGLTAAGGALRRRVRLVE